MVDTRPLAMARSIQIGLHAYPQLRVDGRAVPLHLKRAWALVACLADHERKISRVHAADLLWPDAPTLTGRTRLRRLMHQINTVAGLELVAGDTDAIWLAHPDGGIDVDLLETRQTALRVLDSAASPVQADRLLQPSSHTILADFSLSSESFESWLGARRQEHERLLARALQRLAERQMQHHQPEAAMASARRLLEIDPFADGGHALVLEALGRLGRGAALEAAYDQCASLIRHEFGVRPSAAVEAAYSAACAALQGEIPLRRVAPAAEAATPASAPKQQIRFAHSHDGVRLAYACSGRGTPLIKAATWLSHLEFDWLSPVWSHLLRELSRDFSYVRYDERGCGLSDWEVDDLSFESWIRDLETVVEALRVDRFALLGISQGASIAIAYAVRHPERVTRLVLHGGYARGRLVRSNTPEQREEAETMAKLAELGWGKADPSFRQFFTSQFIPGGTPAQHQWFNELERISSSPRNAARFMREFANIDVVDLLPQVRCPTLVLHSRDDVRVPFEESRLLATAIPGARLVPIASGNHLLLENEDGWPQWIEEVAEFLGTPGDVEGTPRS